jgi:hypothetical protein
MLGRYKLTATLDCAVHGYLERLPAVLQVIARMYQLCSTLL